jgi:aerobic-type carbon monoxide dehydrogenase small subunit (CoxS/CutS family)
MAEQYEIRVNGTAETVTASPDKPLLYILMNDLDLKGPRFGCGLAQCGSCSVLVDDVETRSCVTPISAVAGKAVTTLEGVPAWHAEKAGLAEPPEMHPLQEALIEEQAVQCGYCYNGMIVKAAELLADNPGPSDSEIRAHMNGHICRCGTHPRIMKAIRRASDQLQSRAEAEDTT